MDYNEMIKLADEIDEHCERNGLEICTYNAVNILQERGMLISKQNLSDLKQEEIKFNPSDNWYRKYAEKDKDFDEVGAVSPELYRDGRLKQEFEEKLAKHLIEIMWIGAELGIENSSLRNMTKEIYYQRNKVEWDNKAKNLISIIQSEKLAEREKQVWDKAIEICEGQLNYQESRALKETSNLPYRSRIDAKISAIISIKQELESERDK